MLIVVYRSKAVIAAFVAFLFYRQSYILLDP